MGKGENTITLRTLVKSYSIPGKRRKNKPGPLREDQGYVQNSEYHGGEGQDIWDPSDCPALMLK